MSDSLSTMRADVIEKFINIENIVNGIISQHYFGYVETSFVFDFLYDEYCSFALKRNLLFKICPELNQDKKDKEKLYKIYTIRNYFAHCGMRVTQGNDPNGPRCFPDSKNFEKEIKFDDLYSEFLKLESALTVRLFAVFIGKGGVALEANHHG